MDRLAQTPARVRPERVAVGPLQDDAPAVDVDAVALPHLHGAKAEPFRVLVDRLAALEQRDADLVKVGRFRRPQFGGRRPGAQGSQAARRGAGERRADGVVVRVHDLRPHLPACGPGRHAMGDDIHPEGAVGPGVDGDAVDGGDRGGLEVDGPVDAAEGPVIALTLGAVDRFVGRPFVDDDRQVVGAAQPHQGGDVVPETVEAALVLRARRLAVDLRPGIGHDPFKHQEDRSGRPNAPG